MVPRLPCFTAHLSFRFWLTRVGTVLKTGRSPSAAVRNLYSKLLITTSFRIRVVTFIFSVFYCCMKPVVSLHRTALWKFVHMLYGNISYNLFQFYALVTTFTIFSRRFYNSVDFHERKYFPLILFIVIVERFRLLYKSVNLFIHILF